MGKKTLLIIDFQNDFVPGERLPVAHGGKIAPRVNELVDSEIRIAGGEVKSPPWARALERRDLGSHAGEHAAFFRAIPEGSEGGRAVQLDGVIATVSPAVPERSLPNSVASLPSRMSAA